MELAELDGARVRIAVQSTGVKVTVLDGTMDPGTRQALDRELEKALENRGFDLAGEGRERKDRNGQQETDNRPVWTPAWSGGVATTATTSTTADAGVRL